MKVAYLGIKGLPAKGGADRVVEAIISRLPNDIEAYVYCDAELTPPNYTLPNVKIIRVNPLHVKYLRPISLLSASAVHALLWGKYDLIHIHNVESCFVVPLLRLRFKVIATSHGAAYTREKWNRLARFLIRLMDYFFFWFPDILTCVSKPMIKEYSKFGRPVIYIPNGVETPPDLDEQASLDTLKSAGVDHQFLLFAAGRMDPTKGCHLLLQAFEKIDREDIQLVIVGDATSKPDYGNQLLCKANKKIRFIPFINSKSELMGIYKQSTVFIFPSTVEAMSMVLLEVASLGRPIICSDISANISVMGKFALFFRNNDVNELAEKIKWGLENYNEIEQMGRKGQAWIFDNFSWDSIVPKYCNLYKETVFNNTPQDEVVL